MTKIRTLIIDDMPLSRARTRRYLDGVADVDIVGEYGDAESAREAIECLKPDLLFLDVQMPGMSGLELLERFSPDERPAVVFITAFHEFAVPAFEVQAVDYLLKPFDHERMVKALERVRGALAGRGKEAPREGYLTRLAVKSHDRTTFVEVGAIDWIESASNYVCVHAGEATHVVRETMIRLETQLDPRQFARIHRSAIVRLDRIREIRPLASGDRMVLLTDGKELTLSRSYRDQLKDRLGGL